jgi:hypothetical protein
MRFKSARFRWLRATARPVAGARRDASAGIRPRDGTGLAGGVLGRYRPTNAGCGPHPRNDQSATASGPHGDRLRVFHAWRDAAGGNRPGPASSFLVSVVASVPPLIQLVMNRQEMQIDHLFIYTTERVLHQAERPVATGRLGIDSAGALL